MQSTFIVFDFLFDSFGICGSLQRENTIIKMQIKNLNRKLYAIIKGNQILNEQVKIKIIILYLFCTFYAFYLTHRQLF